MQIFSYQALGLFLCAFLLSACDLGTPQGAIEGVSQAAPKLEEFTERGDYHPYYTTAEMNTARYFAVSLLGRDGRVLVFGGSDERGLASLDTVEIYDQTTFDSSLAQPESQSGLWIDTNFEGDPIIAPAGGRLLFTATELSNGQILILGGSGSIGSAPIATTSELFDPLTREFSGGESEMNLARFGQAITQLPTGEILIVGGQTQENMTTQDTGGLGGQGGQGGAQNVAVFPSTGSIEVYDPRDGSFSFLTDVNGLVSELPSNRGRSGAVITQVAGPDQRMNSSDDLAIHLGGYKTLSAASGQAPTDKAAQIDGAEVAIEVFNSITRSFTQLAGVRLDIGRTPGPEAINLGQHNDFTPDGVRGMGNALLVTNGGPFIDELFIMNFNPGAGPAQGIQVFRVIEDRFNSHSQGGEYNDLTARYATNYVALPRKVETIPGVDNIGTWVFALAGTGVTASLDAGCVFDPYFSLRSANLFNLDPTNTENERQTQSENFLGIVGCWMTLDGVVSSSIDDFGTTPASRWAETNGGFRVWGNCVALNGVDGIRDTTDDRILLVGGGDGLADGGEPVVPSAEVFLPPGSSL